jgi:hypothetical protein
VRPRRAKPRSKPSATRKDGNLLYAGKLRLVREKLWAALREDEELCSKKSLRLAREALQVVLKDPDLSYKKTQRLLGKVLSRLGGRWIVLGEDDDISSIESLRLALEGDERVILRRQARSLPQSQNEKDFLAGKIPRKKKPPKIGTLLRHIAAVQVCEYCKRLGYPPWQALDQVSSLFGATYRKNEWRPALKTVRGKSVTLWSKREVSGRKVSRQKFFKWRREVRALMGKDATKWADWVISKHGHSEKGLQYMIKYLELLQLTATAEHKLDDTARTKALSEIVRAHPKFNERPSPPPLKHSPAPKMLSINNRRSGVTLLWSEVTLPR